MGVLALALRAPSNTPIARKFKILPNTSAARFTLLLVAVHIFSPVSNFDDSAVAYAQAKRVRLSVATGMTPLACLVEPRTSGPQDRDRLQRALQRQYQDLG